MSARPRGPREQAPALGALTVAERGELLDDLLAARPELWDSVEALAVRRMSDEDRSGVADEVASVRQRAGAKRRTNCATFS